MVMHHGTKTEKAPQISVIIPVYNSEVYLEQCLQSVQASTYPDLEIICVDDGSCDRSLEILRSYAGADPRIRILTQDHQFVGKARNTGIREARGRYIHFMDSDDEILPDAYEKLLAAALPSHAEICECLYEDTDAASGKVLRSPGYLRINHRRPLSVTSGGANARSLIFGHVVVWNKLFLRDFLIRNSILFPDLICAEDRPFYFESIFKAGRIVRIPDRLIRHRVHIPTSLDGSDIRLRHFDVEFRSFEQIWETAGSAPRSIRKMVLENCITDSLFYYFRARGTAFAGPLRELLLDYWQPYIPELGISVRSHVWYMDYLNILLEDRSDLYGRISRWLYDRFTEANDRTGPVSFLTRVLIRFVYIFFPLPASNTKRLSHRDGPVS